jgi:hypothetical protein
MDEDGSDILECGQMLHRKSFTLRSKVSCVLTVSQLGQKCNSFGFSGFAFSITDSM